MKKYKYIRINPAGNITGFVLENVDIRQRPRIANLIMDKIDSSVEQVAFISKDEKGNYRMDMMGGEFCGNGTRSFGLFLGKELGLEGENTLAVNVSGAKKPVEVKVDLDKMDAQIAMEPAKKVEKICLGQGLYTTVFLSGIVHVIVGDRKESRDYAKEIIDDLSSIYKEDAYGVLFYDEKDSSMIPYVYVADTKSLVREGSCGSGTTALGYYLNTNKDKDFSQAIKQPGGTIEVIGHEKEGDLIYKIGGKVDFGPVEEIELNIL